jgi:AraC-like DNA-binding protein
MALSNRKALVLYLFHQNRAHDVPAIMSQLVNLDEFDGDRIPLQTITEDIELAASILQEDYLGLRIINLLDVEQLPLYKGIKQCIEVFSKGKVDVPFVILCRLISRYFQVATESIQVRLVENKQSLLFEFFPSMPEHVSLHQIDGAMLGVFKILQAFSNLKPLEMRLAHRTSSHGIEIYKQYFSVPAKLGCEKNVLIYPSLMSQALQETELANFAIGPLQNMLDKEFPHSSYANRCQHILQTLMGISEPTREQVAQVLNMSVSSLQRRLREEGSSFQQVLLATRKTLAHTYLILEQKTATEAAFLLGYQSSSQFFKAFKNWYGITPMAYQDQHKD